MSQAWAWFKALGYELSLGPRTGEVTAVYHHKNQEAITTHVWPLEQLATMAEISMRAHHRNHFNGSCSVVQ